MNQCIYIGNRSSCLLGLYSSGISNEFDIRLLAPTGSYLANDKRFGRDVTCFDNRVELEGLLDKANFNILISTGCPYRIDTSKYKQSLLINIHPSKLPFLRGRDPGIGAIVSGAPLAVSAHLMNNEFDDGDILWQSAEINIDEAFDIRDVYALSAMYEYQAGAWIGRSALAGSLVKSAKENIYTDTDIPKSFSRDKHYGRYYSCWTNLELVRAVKSCCLSNYGLECRIINSKDGSSTSITIVGISILKESTLAIEQFLSDHDKIVYYLENKLLWCRDGQLLSVETRENLGFYYMNDSDDNHWDIQQNNI